MYASVVNYALKSVKYIWTGFTKYIAMMCLVPIMTASAQDATLTRLKQLVATKGLEQQSLPRERIYVHTDREQYAPNDTIWLKLYLLNAELASSLKSGIIYLELINSQFLTIKRFRLPVRNGIGWGNLTLNDSDFRPGGYTLKAYTNWMRNFSDDPFFEKSIHLRAENQLPATADLSRNKLDKLAAKPQNQLLSNRIKTAIDFQFFPEGGRIITGIPTKIAYKALDQQGRPIAVDGKILNSKGEALNSFKTVHHGMGAVVMLPEQDVYTAQLTLPDGTRTQVNLPLIHKSGTSLLADLTPADSLLLKIQASPDLLGSYMLIGESGQAVVYAVRLNLGFKGIAQWIPKSILPAGVVKFTLMDSLGHPLNQRLVFIAKPADFQAQVNAVKEVFAVGDSISANIQVVSPSGQPLVGSFSMAVRPEMKGLKTFGNGNILTAMLLNAEVKGKVDDSGYYDLHTRKGAADIDLLLLTQGWVDYRYTAVLPDSTKLRFPPEPDAVVSGKVKNAFGKSMPGVAVQLFGNKPATLMQSVTDSQGVFTFTDLPVSDTLSYHIQAGKKGSTAYTLAMNEFIPPVLSPKYVNSWKADDSEAESPAANAKIIETAQEVTSQAPAATKATLIGMNQLNEVKVSGKRIIRDSHNLNGPGNADLIFDEKELEAVGRKNLLDLLTERIKGFRFGNFPANPSMGVQHLTYLIDNKEVRLVIDGYQLAQLYTDKSALQYLTWYLKNIKAEDVKGLEVMYSTKYNSSYNSSGVKYNLSAGVANFIAVDWAYIEITTRSGNGAFTAYNSNNYIFRPIPFLLAKDFYVPKYSTGSNNADKAATVFWAPNLITDALGKVVISFRAPVLPGIYNYVLEGANLAGGVAFTSGKFIVK